MNDESDLGSRALLVGRACLVASPIQNADELAVNHLAQRLRGRVVVASSPGPELMKRPGRASDPGEHVLFSEWGPPLTFGLPLKSALPSCICSRALDRRLTFVDFEYAF